ncbi:MAG: tetratricopeptide repeat protein [Gemmatimonadaceae bacterium]
MLRPRIHLAIAAASALTIAACGGKPDHAPAKEPPVSTVTPTVAPETASTAPAVSPNVSYETADSVFRARQYATAADMFDAYSSRHPKNPWGFYMLGLSAWKSGALDRADTAFETAIALDPKNVKSLVNSSRVLLDENRVADARERVGQALAVDSGNVEAWRVLGRVDARAGRVDDALDAYHTALSLDPQDAWSMNNMGLLLVSAGRFEEALGPLARAVQLNDSVAAFQNNLGLALERTGHITLASQAYQAALGIDSTYGKSVVSLARVRGHSDQPGIDSVTVASMGDTFAEEIEGWRTTRKVAVTTPAPDSAKRP